MARQAMVQPAQQGAGPRAESADPTRRAADRQAGAPAASTPAMDLKSFQIGEWAIPIE